MENMHFLKKNNRLAILILIIVFFSLSFFYLDKLYLSWLWEFKKSGSSIYAAIDAVYPFINYASNGLSFIAIIILLLILGRFYNKRFYETGIILGAGFAGTGIAAQLLKHLIGRARPKLTENLIMIGPSWKSSHDSFPSGHTSIAFCFAYILSNYYPKYKAFFYMLAVFVGVGRLKTPSHFLSDVLAGALVGLLLGKLTTQYFTPFLNSQKQHSTSNKYS
jgi:undecaprenyl-diphosphatase